MKLKPRSSDWLDVAGIRERFRLLKSHTTRVADLRIEPASRGLGLVTVLQVARAANVSVDWLLFGGEDRGSYRGSRT